MSWKDRIKSALAGDTPPLRLASQLLRPAEQAVAAARQQVEEAEREVETKRAASAEARERALHALEGDHSATAEHAAIRAGQSLELAEARLAFRRGKLAEAEKALEETLARLPSAEVVASLEQEVATELERMLMGMERALEGPDRLYALRQRALPVLGVAHSFNAALGSMLVTLKRHERALVLWMRAMRRWQWRP
jgi:hypothetical protein